MVSKKNRPRKVKIKSLPTELMEYAKEYRDGFTIQIVDGYIVPFSPSKDSRFLITSESAKGKKQVIRNFRKFKDGIVSGWYDKKEDKFYIDKNIAVANEGTAHELARKYKQKSIRDAYTKKDIDIPTEKNISQRRKKKISEKAVARDIERGDKHVQRYYVKGDMYEKGYFFDSNKHYWIHAKRFTYFSARGFYRVDTVPPPQFYSTGLIFKKIWTGVWLPLNHFNALLDRILRPNLSHKRHWYNCYRFFSYEYKSGYLYYQNGKLNIVVLEQYYKEKN